MDHKIQLGLALDPAELVQLDELAKERHTSRSSLINDAVVECVDYPETFGRIIGALVAREDEVPPSTKKIRTSVLVNVSYLDRLDQLARKLVISRNSLINIIMGESISGLFNARVKRVNFDLLSRVSIA